MAIKKNLRYEWGNGQKWGENGVENVTGVQMRRVLGAWLYKNVYYLTALNWTPNINSMLCVFYCNLKKLTEQHVLYENV